MAKVIIILTFTLFTVNTGIAQDRIELKTTTIKGNKELPKILYIVPWKEVKQNRMTERKLVLHSLFGDLFDPVLPQQIK